MASGRVEGRIGLYKWVWAAMFLNVAVGPACRDYIALALSRQAFRENLVVSLQEG